MSFQAEVFRVSLIATTERNCGLWNRRNEGGGGVMRRVCWTLLCVLVGCIPIVAKKSKKSDQETFKEALSLEQSSGGNAEAEFLLGDSYESGRGVPQDYSEALRWYLKSANRGCAAAQVPLAWLYFSH